MFRLSLLVLPVLVVAASASADTLVLANGDRLTGRVVSIEGDRIHFETEALGLLSATTDRARVERDEPPSPPAESAPSPRSNQPAKPRFTDVQSMDLRAAVRDPERARSGSESGWRRRIEFGLSGQRNGADRTDLSLRFEMARRGLSNETRLLMRHLYGKTDAHTTSDNSSANLRFRVNLSPVLFGQSTTSYDRDALRGVRQDAQQGLGFGRNLIARDNLIVAMGAGAALRHREAGRSSDGLAYLVDAFQDLRFQINENLSLTQDVAMLVAPARGDDYRVKFNAAVNTRLTELMELSMRYEYEFDRAVAANERESQRLVTSLGVVF